jgi:hypothetical protein
VDNDSIGHCGVPDEFESSADDEPTLLAVSVISGLIRDELYNDVI